MAKEKTVTIPLEFPVELADRKLDAVTIQRPTLGDLEDFPVNASTGLKEEMALVAHLCDLHAEDLRRIDAGTTASCRRSFSSFGEFPSAREIRRSALILRRFGGFRQAEVMGMTWPQACEELQEALELERELNRA